jgi:hypothetical protein
VQVSHLITLPVLRVACEMVKKLSRVLLEYYYYIKDQFIERELNILFELNFNARLTHESETWIGSI